MAKRPCYPGDITRRYDELPEDHPRRTTDEKLEAAFILEKHWDDQTSFKDLAERDEVSVSSYTISRTWRDFFGPTDEDYTFYELGKNVQEERRRCRYGVKRVPCRTEERPVGRVQSCSKLIQVRGQRKNQWSFPETARELEIAQWYYQRGCGSCEAGRGR